MASNLTTADRIAMYLGGGLILLGIPVMGLVEILMGSTHTIPETNEAGEIVHHTTLNPDLRAAIILAGLLVWGLYAIYVVVARRGGGTQSAEAGTPQ